MSKKTIVDGDVTTEIMDLSGGVAGDLDTEAILAKMGGKAGSYTETRPDGTTVTYEVDLEEEEIEYEVEEVITTTTSTKVIEGTSSSTTVYETKSSSSSSKQVRQS